jgi:putative spermidine/putrescine transport system permease protein
MPLPPHATTGQRLWLHGYRAFCALVLLFLILPILIVAPLSFNATPYFSFTSGMLRLDPEAYSLRWYLDILENGMANPALPRFGWAYLADAWQHSQWIHAARNSVFIGIVATLLATSLGTLAALGLSQADMPGRKVVMSVLISPMIVPVIITAAGLYFFFAGIGLANSYTGIILSHALLGMPFVVITVTATLAGFDRSLARAAGSLGAGPATTFLRVILPLILPGVISGALFAFVTSFDEVVVVIFLAGYEQQTIPRQMWAGIREQISPTILAVATILVLVSIALLTTVELLRRRSSRLRGLGG